MRIRAEDITEEPPTSMDTDDHDDQDDHDDHDDHDNHKGDEDHEMKK